MNIVKVIRFIRDLKILMNNSLMSPGMKHQIRNSKKNIINLEEGSRKGLNQNLDLD